MSIAVLDMKQEEGYFFSREKLNAFKKKYLKNKAVGFKKAVSITAPMLTNTSVADRNDILNQEIRHLDLKKQNTALAEDLEHKNRRYIQYTRCDRSELDKYFTMKLSDFFPITGFI